MNRLNLIKPFAPSMEELIPYLSRILESRYLTNNGPVHQEFEKALAHYLGVEHICLTSSGTMALIIALKAMDLRGEVITTPFTSIATAQAVYWNNLTPVFVDICEDDLNIDVGEIERAITADTCAILPVHIYGNPCKVDQIRQLADHYNPRVLYDAAHSFGVRLKGQSICEHGDMSTLSFHATKVFNSLEGGAVVCNNKETSNYLKALANNGIDEERNLAGYGLNAKMNEIQSAFGLVQLQHTDALIENRKRATMKYREMLKDAAGVRLMEDQDHVHHNYSYFPVIVNPDELGATRDELAVRLERNDIVTRKYFHPLVCDYPQYMQFRTRALPVAEKIAENVLCLPLFHDIGDPDIQKVAGILNF